MPICKIDHAQPDALPAFLCHVCHPELVPTPAERAASAAADKADRAKANARARAERELRKAQHKLNSITRNGTREPDEGSVNAKITTSMRKKITRLQKELEQ
jgi:hypothetical protein